LGSGVRAQGSRGRGRVTRRDALRILAVAGAAGAGWGLGALDRARSVSRSRVLMGTGVHLSVLGPDPEAASAAAEAALAEMTSLEALLSRYRADSEVSRLNTQGRVDGASTALLDVLRLADRIHRLGDGGFDVSIQPLLDLYRSQRDPATGLPAAAAVERALERVDQRALRIEGRRVTRTRPDLSITLDGIAKGYVVDGGVSALAARGFANVLVEAGGDLVASGDKGAGTPWRLGIRSPRQGLALEARFDARNRAVATSGDYMQPFTADYAQHHILDPRTGRSAPELASATVLAPDAATADGLATLVMVLGPRRGRALLEDLPDCEGYLVSKQLAVVRTSGFSVIGA
jgi:thiamine biosynthesis lipoprotein